MSHHLNRDWIKPVRWAVGPKRGVSLLAVLPIILIFTLSLIPPAVAEEEATTPVTRSIAVELNDAWRNIHKAINECDKPAYEKAIEAFDAHKKHAEQTRDSYRESIGDAGQKGLRIFDRVNAKDNLKEARTIINELDAILNKLPELQEYPTPCRPGQSAKVDWEAEAPKICNAVLPADINVKQTVEKAKELRSIRNGLSKSSKSGSRLIEEYQEILNNAKLVADPWMLDAWLPGFKRCLVVEMNRLVQRADFFMESNLELGEKWAERITNNERGELDIIDWQKRKDLYQSLYFRLMYLAEHYAVWSKNFGAKIRSPEEAIDRYMNRALKIAGFIEGVRMSDRKKRDMALNEMMIGMNYVVPLYLEKARQTARLAYYKNRGCFKLERRVVRFVGDPGFEDEDNESIHWIISGAFYKKSDCFDIQGGLIEGMIEKMETEPVGFEIELRSIVTNALPAVRIAVGKDKGKRFGLPHLPPKGNAGNR